MFSIIVSHKNRQFGENDPLYISGIFHTNCLVMFSYLYVCCYHFDLKQLFVGLSTLYLPACICSLHYIFIAQASNYLSSANKCSQLLHLWVSEESCLEFSETRRPQSKKHNIDESEYGSMLLTLIL